MRPGKTANRYVWRSPLHLEHTFPLSALPASDPVFRIREYSPLFHNFSEHTQPFLSSLGSFSKFLPRFPKAGFSGNWKPKHTLARNTIGSLFKECTRLWQRRDLTEGDLDNGNHRLGCGSHCFESRHICSCQNQSTAKRDRST